MMAQLSNLARLAPKVGGATFRLAAVNVRVLSFGSRGQGSTLEELTDYAVCSGMLRGPCQCWQYAS